MHEARRIVRQHLRAYVALNVTYYGLTLAGMLLVTFLPLLQDDLLDAVRRGYRDGPLQSVAEAYQGSDFLLAVLWTFGVNLLAGTILTIIVPSLIVPFSGVLMGVVRAALWGLILSPAHEDLSAGAIPHAITLILEGQAYILAMLAAYIHGKAFISPRSVRATTRASGYAAGLRLSMKLYPLIVVVLAVAAVYEAFELIYLVPWLSGTS